MIFVGGTLLIYVFFPNASSKGCKEMKWHSDGQCCLVVYLMVWGREVRRHHGGRRWITSGNSICPNYENKPHARERERTREQKALGKGGMNTNKRDKRKNKNGGNDTQYQHFSAC